MTAPCVACGDRIALDGYCAGCCLRAGGHQTPAERFADRLGRGQVGFTVFIVTALSLFVLGTRPEQFGLGGSGDGAGAGADIQRAEWWWWPVGAGAILLTMMCRGLMTARAPSGLGRMVVWLALITAWAFSGFLGFRSAQACRAAFLEAGEKARTGRESAQRIEHEIDSLRHAYWERGRNKAKPAGDPAALDLLTRFAERDPEFDPALRRLEKDREGPVNQLATSDALRWQSGVLFGACLAAMASVVALLFLVAAEQGWEAARARRAESVEAEEVE